MILVLTLGQYDTEQPVLLSLTALFSFTSNEIWRFLRLSSKHTRSFMKRAVPPPNPSHTSRGKEIESLKASDLFLVTLSQDYNTPQNTLHPTSSRAAVISVLSLPLFFCFVYEDRQPLLWTAGPPPRLVLGIFRTLYAISMLFFETT